MGTILDEMLDEMHDECRSKVLEKETKKKNQAEELKEIISSIDNMLFMLEGPTSSLIPPRIHIEGCIGWFKEKKEYFNNLLKDAN